MSFRFRIQTCFPPKKSVSPPKIACIPKCILSVSQCIPVHRHHLENTHRIHRDTCWIHISCILITNPTTFDNKPPPTPSMYLPIYTL